MMRRCMECGREIEIFETSFVCPLCLRHLCADCYREILTRAEGGDVNQICSCVAPMPDLRAEIRKFKRCPSGAMKGQMEGER